MPLIYLIAGEPSGDALGARLMAALKRVGQPDLRFAGVGGERMIAEGLTSLFPMSELSVMGLAEVVPRIPRLLGRMRETARAIREQSPDVVVTIDAPDFCKGVWKRLGRRDRPKLIHYVAPTVWAWRPGRARKLARRIDRIMCLLPFEPPYFEKEGLAASFVGHPVLETGADTGDGPSFRKRHRISDDAKLLCVLPGSRSGEIKRMLPVFAETVAILRKKFLNLVIVMPTVAATKDAVQSAASAFGPQVLVIEGDAEKYDAMAASDAALAASGTVALELGLARVPMVIAYRVNALTAAVARRMIKVRFATITNLLLDREAVPELIQGACRPDRLAVEVSLMIEDRAVRAAQRDASAAALAMLGAGGIPPSEQAARVVLAEIGAKIAAD